MKKYYFDTNARVRFWCEAESEDEAIEKLTDSLDNADGAKIDLDSYSPEKVTDVLEDEDLT